MNEEDYPVIDFHEPIVDMEQAWFEFVRNAVLYFLTILLIGVTGSLAVALIALLLFAP